LSANLSIAASERCKYAIAELRSTLKGRNRLSLISGGEALGVRRLDAAFVL
jgi:hypothetical protein